ncbi:hypothetical protein ACHQM5_011720 [Ranunculus cassubicifolius]
MIKVGPLGDSHPNTHGTVNLFDHMGKRGVCRIYVSHGSCLNSIQIAYVEGNTVDLSEKWGGSGSLFETVVLDYPNEVLTGIRGEWISSDNISSITNHYSRSKYNISFEPDEFFGLHGRADSNSILAIGVHIKPPVKTTSSALTQIKSEPTC